MTKASVAGLSASLLPVQDWRRRIERLVDAGADQAGSPHAEQLDWHITQFRNVRSGTRPHVRVPGLGVNAGDRSHT